jgi:hypothetical protein
MALCNIGVDVGAVVIAFFVQACSLVVVFARAFMAFCRVTVLVLGGG